MITVITVIKMIYRRNSIIEKKEKKKKQTNMLDLRNLSGKLTKKLFYC